MVIIKNQNECVKILKTFPLQFDPNSSNGSPQSRVLVFPSIKCYVKTLHGYRYKNIRVLNTHISIVIIFLVRVHSNNRVCTAHGAQYKFWERLKTFCGSPQYTNCRNVIITVPAWFTATGSHRRRPCLASKRPCTNSRLSSRPVLSAQNGGYYTCHVTRRQTVYYAFIAIYSGSIVEFFTQRRIGYNRLGLYAHRGCPA